MWINPVWTNREELQLSASLTRELLAEDRLPGCGLAEYLENYERVAAKSLVETALAERLASAPDGALPPDVPDLPPAALERRSGALLAWVIQQVRRAAEPLPGILDRRPVLSDRQYVIFARAWALWPQSPALSGEGAQQSTFEWLAHAPQSLGWAAVALARAGSAELAKAAAGRWLAAGPPPEQCGPVTAAWLAAPALADAAVHALHRITLTPDTPRGDLVKLCSLAFTNGLYRSALEIVPLVRPHLAPAEIPQIEAIRIASLAMSRQAGAAIAAFREHWLQDGDCLAPFPYPEVLLQVPILSTPAAADVRDGLLRNCVDGDRTPQWVALERRDQSGESYLTVPAWYELYLRNPKNPYFLVRLTAAILGAPRTLGQAYRAAVTEQWERLARIEQWHDVAHAALLLLDLDPTAQIGRYREHLVRADPAAHFLIAEAQQRYMECLVWMKQWDRLREFFAGRNAVALGQVAGIEELRFWERLAAIETTFQQGSDWDGWCRGVEQLIGLRLRSAQIWLALDYLAGSLRQLRREQPAVLADLQVHDVELQWIRRGKHEGERLLALIAAKNLRTGDFRARLARADLDGLPELLRELRASAGGVDGLEHY